MTATAGQRRGRLRRQRHDHVRGAGSQPERHRSENGVDGTDNDGDGYVADWMGDQRTAMILMRGCIRRCAIEIRQQDGVDVGDVGAAA